MALNPSVAAAADDDSRWTMKSGWFLGFLTIISMYNYLDRSILGLVLPLVQADLQLSDTALGLISGVAFVLFYSTLGIPIASYADHGNRRNIVAVGFGFWSLMTFISGSVQTGWQMAGARFMMGAGEACGLAPSQSMIADRFAPEKRSMALSIFTAAFAIDALLFLPIAAWISDTYGWRTAFHVAGISGIVLAVLFYLTVREPERRKEAEPKPKVPLTQAIRVLGKSTPYLLILLGTSFTGGALYAVGTWNSAFLVRVHGMSITEIGAVIGPIRGVLGMIGILGAGWLADRLGRGNPKWKLWVPALTCVFFVPGQLMLLLSDNWYVWMGGLMITGLLASAYQGRSTPPRSASPSRACARLRSR